MKTPLFAASLALALAASTAPPRQSAPPSPAHPPTPDQALAALASGQPAAALADYRQILAADPGNAVACLYASTAAMELYDGALAVQYAEKARQLDPQSWKVHTTLVAAYASAGMKAQRDRERGILAQLHSTGAPDARKASGFLLEMFPAGPAHVEAIQYFAPVGKFHTYYRFLIHQPGVPAREIDIQSNDFDETSWEQTHAAQAAAGERHFQLTDATGTADYRTFSGKPDYDQIRAMVIAILQAQPPPK